MYRIGIIVRPKKTDALICQALARSFDVVVAQYGVPHLSWCRWVIKRLRTAGPIALMGHLSLSLFIRLGQIHERLTGKTIWEEHGVTTPSWKGLGKMSCGNEQILQQRLKDADLIIALDAYRLSQSFFRKLDAPFFEIVWGDATKYLGDSAAFWEYAMGHTSSSMVSVVERVPYFQRVAVVAQIPVTTVSPHETLRSLKVKQAISLSDQIAHVVKEILRSSVDDPQECMERTVTINQCYAPTLWTYARHRWFGLPAIPRYARRPKRVMLKMRRNQTL